MREAGSTNVARRHSPLGAASEELSDGEACSIAGTDLESETWATDGKKKRHCVGVMAKLDGVTQQAEPEDRPGGKVKNLKTRSKG